MLLVWLMHIVQNQAVIEINKQVNYSSKSFIWFRKGVSIRLSRLDPDMICACGRFRLWAVRIDDV